MSSSESHFDAFREERNDRQNFIDDAAKLPEQPLFDASHPAGNGEPLNSKEAVQFEMLAGRFKETAGKHTLTMPFDTSDVPKRDREKLRDTPIEENE